MCNRENIKPESGIVVLVSFFCLYREPLRFQDGTITCKLAGNVLKVLEKSDIGMFVLLFFTVYCTKLLADVYDASLREQPPSQH